MTRPKTKSDLLAAARAQYDRLTELIESLSPDGQRQPFAFDVAGRRQAHWNRDRNIRDVLIHLHEWHNLLLAWVHANARGERRAFLPEPYNWKNYGQLNVEFWQNHQITGLDRAKELLASTHQAVVGLLESFDDDKLFTKGRLAWTGTTTLGSYFVSATSSHYEWARKKINMHRKALRVPH